MNIRPTISTNLPLLPSADYAAINVAALRNGRSLIQELLPGVRIRSLECIIDDFVINYRDFAWEDRSKGVTGADLISGLAHVYGCGHDEAARLVAEKLAVLEAGAHRNNNPASIPLDDEQSQRFLKLLDPSASGFTFQSFDDDRARKNPALTRIIQSPPRATR